MIQMILGVLGSGRVLIPLILVASMGIGWLWTSRGYKNTITERDKKIELLEKTVSEKEKEILKNELKISVHEANELVLKDSLTKSNNIIKQNLALEDDMAREIEKWKHQKPKEVIKYVERIVNVKDKKNITLQECKDVNEKISKIKYKDL